MECRSKTVCVDDAAMVLLQYFDAAGQVGGADDGTCRVALGEGIHILNEDVLGGEVVEYGRE